MRVKLKKIDIVDDIIWIVIIFQLMLGNLFGITNNISLILLILIICSSLKDLTFFAKKGLLILTGFLCCILIYPFYNYHRNGGNIYILLNNIFYIVTPLAILLYLAKSCSIKSEYTKKKLVDFCPILNYYALANIIVMIGQLIINKNQYSNEVAYWDSISGLFGEFGTPISTLYVSFVIVYDYLMIRYNKNKKLKSLFLIILIANPLLSLLNDNKGFYLILLIYVGFTWLVANYEWAARKHKMERGVKFALKLISVVLISIGLLVILIQYTPVGEFYNKIVHALTMGWMKTNLMQGSSERIGMISFALSSPQIKYWGAGLATYIWKKEYAFNFVHFGQSDIGVFIILGGLCFCVILVFYLLMISRKLFKRKVLVMAAVVVMIVLGIYTQVFTNISMMISTVLYLLLCWYTTEIIEVKR